MEYYNLLTVGKCNEIFFCCRFVKNLIVKRLLSAPIVDSWFFMESPTLVLRLLTGYLIVIFLIGPWFMRNRNAYSLNNVTRAYNLFQIVACSSVVIEFFKRGFIFDGTFDCSKGISDESRMNLLRIWYFATFIRVIELIETVFFILRKKEKQASILHIYHHIGSIVGPWMCLKYDGSKWYQRLCQRLCLNLFALQTKGGFFTV